ncbi:transcription/translation regulatory transformer protein RfaH [Pseudomonas sp. DTU_2021_1001937_2_SI_NGA_ILE_001]|uniref:transcription/translation regulatory transformer protein RfaH n=1 Tax=Pseudomonas sp. DTU_2021_1001937_2_SI_NGA_ILE_001 TaxID=3077589 RepID=UPI0025ED3706|nr:transcription/translation regulatory transformer protein RfaH [Pseudomonas sp. DTU_2021_1001937_2_SI_NGA_ILE_001]WNW09650.1 transcription/translation regulatory transformer protein RfaH [Pseudomonas sp. DTU_2021_1001937_2_SI_NGA_ILE_001]
MTASNAPARWYLIQTRPRQDARALEHLQRQHFECYQPITTRAGVREALFPGYLFIRMDQLQDNWYPIRSTRGVARIVTFGGTPAPVQDLLIEQIRQRLATPAAREVFAQGEPVLVRNGGLPEVEAIFLALDGTERAVILLNLLQRQHRVVLPLAHLSRASARA